MAKPLTDAVVDRLTATRGQSGWRDVSDGATRGLRLRISPRGEKAWAVQITVNGKRTRHTLGGYPEVKLADARRLAVAYLAAARGGHGPNYVDARRKAQSMTVQEAHAEYVKKQRANLKPQTIGLKEAMFRDHIAPVIGNRRLRSIRRADVVETVKTEASGHRRRHKPSIKHPDTAPSPPGPRPDGGR